MELILFLILFLCSGALLALVTIGTGFTLLYGTLRMLGYKKELLTPKKMYDIMMGYSDERVYVFS